jgi:hypothetical protein
MQAAYTSNIGFAHVGEALPFDTKRSSKLVFAEERPIQAPNGLAKQKVLLPREKRQRATENPTNQPGVEAYEYPSCVNKTTP